MVFSSLATAFLKITLLLVISFSCQLAFAEDISNRNLRDVTSTYLSHSISNPTKKILKPSNKLPLLFWPRCISAEAKKCNRTDLVRKLHSSILENENARLEYSKTNPDIAVIFADRHIVRRKLAELDETYTKGFRDSGDPECALYYELDASTISKVVILISLDATDFKQRMCLANQFFQGLGLSLADQRPFSKLWDASSNALSGIGEEQFSKLVKAFSIFTFLHMCPDIAAGMTEERVLAVLENDACWRGLMNKN